MGMTFDFMVTSLRTELLRQLRLWILKTYWYKVYKEAVRLADEKGATGKNDNIAKRCIARGESTFYMIDVSKINFFHCKRT